MIRTKTKDRPCAYPNCSDLFPYDIKHKYCPKHRGRVVSGRIEEMSKEELMQKSLPELFDFAIGCFNRFIRERDKDKVCISCGKPFTKSNPIECGHYRPAGTYSGVRFSEINCNGECYQCNNNTPNHLLGYADGLAARIGVLQYAALLAEAELTKGWKWSRDGVSDIIIKYRKA